MNRVKRTARRRFLRQAKVKGPNRFRAMVQGKETVTIPTKNSLVDVISATENPQGYKHPETTQVPGSRRRKSEPVEFGPPVTVQDVLDAKNEWEEQN